MRTCKWRRTVPHATSRSLARGRSAVRSRRDRGRRGAADGGLLSRSRRSRRATRSSAALGKKRRGSGAGERHAVHDRDRAFRSRARRRAQRPPAAASGDVARLAALRDQFKAQDAYWAEQVDIQWRSRRRVGRVRRRAARKGSRRLRAAADIEDATDKSAVTPGRSRPRASCSARCCSRPARRRTHCSVRGIDGEGARTIPRRVRRGTRGRSRRRCRQSARVLRAEPPRSRATPIRRAPSSSGRGATSRVCSSRSADARLSRTRDAA